MYGCHEPYFQIFTHNHALSGSSRLLSRYALPLLRLRLCSYVQLGLSFNMASTARQGQDTIESSSLLFITDLNTALLVERSLTSAIWYISSASLMLECWQNLSKFPQAFSRFLCFISPRCFLHCVLTNWSPGRGYRLTCWYSRTPNGQLVSTWLNI